MPVELAALPVACEFLGDESGYGLLLRCARANGVSLQRLFIHGAVRTPTWPRPGDIENMAFLAGVPPLQLARRLAQRQTVSGRREFSACGHRWMSAAALRIRAPQVCTKCLREANYCRWVWDLAGYCACVRHGIYLTDRCIRCRKPLRWNRPAPDICSCGRYLSPVDGEASVPSPVLAWCRCLEACCGEQGWERMHTDLPGWVLQSGPDGALQIVMAFGRRQRPDESLGTSDAVRVLPPVEMGACIDRGLDRAATVTPEGKLAAAFAALVDEARLERVARHGVEAAARTTARRLLQRIRRQAPIEQLRHPWRSARPGLGQLELFADDSGV